MAEGPLPSVSPGMGGTHRAQRRGVVGRIRELPLGGHDVPVPSGVASGVDNGLDAALLSALWRLPDRQREVIALRVFLDLDIDAIARQRGIAPATVRVHLSRAVAALRQELTPSEAKEANR